MTQAAAQHQLSRRQAIVTGTTLAGGLALGVMMIPIAVRTTEEALRAVPRMLREGALALGTSKWKTVASVVVPAAARGAARRSRSDSQATRPALACLGECGPHGPGAAKAGLRVFG